MKNDLVSPSMSAAFFCETVEDLSSLGSLVPADVDIVAVTPDVAWGCQLRGLSYLTLDDSAPADVTQCRAEIWERLRPWLLSVDELVQGTVRECREADFRPAQAYVYYLYRLFAEHHAGNRTLSAFLENHSWSAIYCREWVPQEALLTLDDRRSIYCSLLPQVAGWYGFRFIGLAAPAAPSVAAESSAATPGGFSLAVGLIGLRRLISGRFLEELRLVSRNGLLAWLRSLWTERRTGQGVLFLGSGYDLDPLAIKLREQGVRVRWKSARLPARSAFEPTLPASTDATPPLMHLWEKIAGTPSLASALPGCDAGSEPRFRRALETFIKDVIPMLWQAHEETKKILKTGRFHALLAGNGGSGGVEGSILQSARSRFGIPGIIYQHGGSSRLCDWAFYDCLMNATDLMLHGDSTADLMNSVSQNEPLCNASLHVVGSARLDILRVALQSPPSTETAAQVRGADPRPVILYVPTHYGGYGRAISELAGYSDIHYFELQQRILRIFASRPEVRVLYKDFPVADSPHNPIPDFIRQHVPNGSVTQTRLTQLLGVVDAIVVDHAITALAEILLTNKPVLVYDHQLGQAPSPDQSTILLRRRASVARTPAEFESALESFLHLKTYAAPVPVNDDFLRAWCTHAGDGQSLSRAMGAVRQIMDVAANR